MRRYAAEGNRFPDIPYEKLGARQWCYGKGKDWLRCSETVDEEAVAARAEKAARLAAEREQHEREIAEVKAKHAALMDKARRERDAKG